MADLAALTEKIRSGDKDGSVGLTQAAIDEGVDPQDILGAMVVAMDEIGSAFQRNEAFVPELLIAARAMKESLALLEPLLVEAGIKPEFVAVIGTVEGDLHDIGKNLVGMMWKGANFEVVDLGTNVAPEKFIEAAAEHKADLIGLSTLLTTTMPAMKRTVEAIRASNVAGTKVLIGGAPITQEFADEIGADGYAADAGAAVQCARTVLAS
jgi:5-methyltetrahydrofolate--homocysteine methyltransferase